MVVPGKKQGFGIHAGQAGYHIPGGLTQDIGKADDPQAFFPRTNQDQGFSLALQPFKDRTLRLPDGNSMLRKIRFAAAQKQSSGNLGGDSFSGFHSELFGFRQGNALRPGMGSNRHPQRMFAFSFRPGCQR